MLPASFKAQVLAFIQQPTPLIGRNKWIEHPRIKVYLYNTERFFVLPDFKGRLPTIVLGNIEVAEACRGQGLYNELLALLCSECEVLDRALYIENVHERSHDLIYLKRGLSVVPKLESFFDYDPANPIDFFKLPSEFFNAKEKTKTECNATTVGGRLGEAEGQASVSA